MHAIPPFHPHPLLRDAHAMTIAGSQLPRGLGYFAAQAEPFWLPVDGATSVLVEAHWQEDPAAPVLVLVHGLSGSSSSPYMLGVAAKAWRRGMAVLRLNIRNCGGTERQTPTLYSAAQTDDVHGLVSWLGRTRPHAPVALAGYSLGGAICLHTLARWGAAPPANVLGLMTVSSPLDIAESNERLHDGRLNRLYMRRFLDGFVQSMRGKAEAYPELYPHDAMRGYRDFHEFDAQWTAPHFGYRSAAEYYDRASALHVLDHIRLPVLMLHADDDPIVPMGERSMAALAGHPTVRLARTRYGGHCAFVGRSPRTGERGVDTDRYWAEHRLVDWAAARFASRYQISARSDGARIMGALAGKSKASA